MVMIVFVSASQAAILPPPLGVVDEIVDLLFELGVGLEPVSFLRQVLLELHRADVVEAHLLIPGRHEVVRRRPVLEQLRLPTHDGLLRLVQRHLLGVIYSSMFGSEVSFTETAALFT